MRCSNCQREVPEGLDLCPHCQSPVSPDQVMVCPVCGYTPANPNSTTCPYCHSQLPVREKSEPKKDIQNDWNSSRHDYWDNSNKPNEGVSDLWGPGSQQQVNDDGPVNVFGGGFIPQPEQPPFGGGFNPQPEQSPFGGGFNPQPEQPPFGGNFNPQPEQPPFGGGFNPQPEQPPFGGGFNPQPEQPPFDQNPDGEELKHLWGDVMIEQTHSASPAPETVIDVNANVGGSAPETVLAPDSSAAIDEATQSSIDEATQPSIDEATQPSIDENKAEEAAPSEPGFELRPMLSPLMPAMPQGIMFEGAAVELSGQNLSSPMMDPVCQARVERQADGSWTIENGSQNKSTYLLVDRPMALRDGDVILLGGNLYVFHPHE